MTDPMVGVDVTDLAILTELTKDGRAPARRIALVTGLSTSAVARRLSRLERKGIVKGYTIDVDYRSLGFPVLAIMQIQFDGPADADQAGEFARHTSEIQMVSMTAGEWDFIIQIRAKDKSHLKRIVDRFRANAKVQALRVLVAAERHSQDGLGSVRQTEEETSIEIDELDRGILNLLFENARRTMGDISSRLPLSTSSAKRRIQRLEHRGVIGGYTIVLDHGKAGRPVQSIMEVRFRDPVFTVNFGMMEVEYIFEIVGIPDVALMILRTQNLVDLHNAIGRLRRSAQVKGTKTLIVLDAWRPRHLFLPTSASTFPKPCST